MSSLVPAYKRARQTGKLNLSTQGLDTFPQKICSLNSNNFDIENWWELVPLEHLNLTFNEIPEVPDEICELQELLSLNLSGNQLASLPVTLSKLEYLRTIDAGSNHLKDLNFLNTPGLPLLSKLVLVDNELTELPDGLCDLPALRTLDVRKNKLTRLPERIGFLTLYSLSLSENKLEALPESFSQLEELTALEVQKNNIKYVPSLKNLKEVKTINFRQNELAKIPDLPREKLQELFLGFNRLTSVSGLTQCSLLSSVGLSNNRITKVPASLAMLKQLKFLDLSNNDLDDIPPQLGLIESLTKLLLSGNAMRRIRKAILNKGAHELKKYLVGRMTEDELKEAMGETDDSPQFWKYAINDAIASKKLKVNGREISKIVEEVWDVPFVSLDFEDNKLASLPREILKLSGSLSDLNLASNAFVDFAESICGLTNLKELCLKKNRISSIPQSIASLQCLTTLDLRNNRFTECPIHVLEIKTLRILYIGFNDIKNVDALWSIKGANLEHLDVSNNRITSIGKGVRHLTKLTFLNLENNDIESIPPEISLCPVLQHMPLTGNALRSLNRSVVSKGTTAILDYLRMKLPEDALAESAPSGSAMDCTPVTEDIEQPLVPVSTPPIQSPQRHVSAQQSPAPGTPEPARDDIKMDMAPDVDTATSSEPAVEAAPDTSKLEELERTINGLEEKLNSFSLTRTKKMELKREFNMAIAARNRERGRLGLR